MTEQRRDPDALRRRAGVRGDPDRDQHFLVDDRVLDRLPGYLPADADTAHLVEIGAGTGALTDRLLPIAGRVPAESGRDGRPAEPGGHVTVVERDPGLAAFLREEFADAVAADRLTVLEGGALEVDFPPFTASVSNLPYGISSEVAFRLLPERRPLVMMFQAEFADRMAAEPGTDEYGRLSVTAGHYADVEVVERVPPTAFDPQPAVESAVVRTTPRDSDYQVGVAASPPRDEEVVEAGLPDDEFFLGFVTAYISGLADGEAVVEAADEALMSKRAGRVTPVEFAELARLAWEVGR